MKCPYCFQELVPGEKQQYQDLVDHAFRPNDPIDLYPPRATFVCTCENSVGSFWDPYGDRYIYKSAPYVYNPKFISSAVGSESRRQAVVNRISKKFDRLTIFLYGESGARWYIESVRLAEFCIRHNIMFGYRI